MAEVVLNKPANIAAKTVFFISSPFWLHNSSGQPAVILQVPQRKTVLISIPQDNHKCR
jgi:hypothetical protein